MDYASRVSTFDIDQEIDIQENEENSGDSIEKEYLMGGAQRTAGTAKKVVPIEAPGQENIVGRLRLLFIISLFCLGTGVLMIYSTLHEINYNYKTNDKIIYYRFAICILGMTVGSLVCASVLFCWVGLWGHQRKEYGPLALAQFLMVLALFGSVAIMICLFFYWTDRVAIGVMPAHGINRFWLSIMSLGLFVVLLFYSSAILTLKWKSAAVFQWTAAAICFVIMAMAIVQVVFCIIALQRHPKLAAWPRCWSIYGSIVFGAVTVVVTLYSMPIKERPQLVNLLVLFPICVCLAVPCYFNYFGSTLDGKRLEHIYLSALLGIGVQAFSAFMFVIGMVWKSYQLPESPEIENY